MGMDPTTLGQPASFVYDQGIVNPYPDVGARITNSNQGVPPTDQIAGETPTPAAAAQGQYAYGKAAAVQAPHNQPLFWSFVLMIGGVLILTHAARVNLHSPV